MFDLQGSHFAAALGCAIEPTELIEFFSGLCSKKLVSSTNFFIFWFVYGCGVCLELEKWFRRSILVVLYN
jgi:hypothetical protein